MVGRYHTKQCGGGCWAMYCNLCNLPYYGPFEDTESVNAKHALYKLRDVDVSWLRRGLGYDKHTKSIMPVGIDDGYGRFPIRGKENKEFVSDYSRTDTEKEFDAFGVVFHEDCVRYINSSFTPLTYEKHEELRKIIDRQYRTKYESQFYEWKMALDREGADYFHSPMIPQGGQTRERINRLLALMPKKPLSCPSHKTKGDCILNDCTWGKTGKCSRKRTITTQKKSVTNSGDCGMDVACRKNKKCSRKTKSK
jgi:hypothetical protein